MASRYTVTVREGPSVQRTRHADLEQALDALVEAVERLTKTARSEPVKVGKRRYDPVNQVAARAEVSGPGRFFPTLQAGVDIRGDGSPETYTGRAQRTPVELREGETAADALRRAVRALKEEGDHR